MAKEAEKLQRQKERRERKEQRAKEAKAKEEKRQRILRLEQDWCDEQDGAELRGKRELELVDPGNESISRAELEVEECQRAQLCSY